MRRILSKKKIELTPDEERNKRAQANLQQAESRYELVTKDHKSVADSVLELKNNVNALKELAESERANIADIKNQKVKAEEESKVFVAAARQTKDETEAELSALNSKLAELRQTVMVEGEKVPWILQKIKESEAEVSRLEAIITEKKSEIKTLEAEGSDKIQQINTLFAKAQENLESVEAMVIELRAQKEGLITDCDEQRAIKESLLAENEQLGIQVSTLKSGISYLEDEKALIQKEIDDGREEKLRVIKMGEENAIEKSRLEKLAASLEEQLSGQSLEKNQINGIIKNG